MAYPIRIGSTVTFHHYCLLDRLPLAALLGTAMSAWAQVERQMMYLYGYLMGLELPRAEGFSAPIHPVALQVFDTLDTLHHRVRLLEELSAWRLAETPDLISELRERVIPVVRIAAKARHNLAHANWGISAAYPNALISVPAFGHQEAYEDRDFHDAIEKSQNAYVAIRDFEAAVRRTRGD